MYIKKTGALDGRGNSSEVLCERIAWCLIALFAFAILSYAFLGPIIRSEVESNEFPIIPLQYHASIFLDESDIELIQRDLPQLYNYASGYLTTHLYQRIQPIEDGSWYYYYFPIYPLLCLPLKLLFQFFGVDQERCFTVTNALLVILSLWFVQRRLKVPAKQRLLAVALLMASPLIYNVNHVYYMACMFAFVTMSLVQYCNGRYRSGALLLSVAGMSNPTIMAVGIVMIAEYFVRTIPTLKKGERSPRGVGHYLLQTAEYGLCYVPCLGQFAVNWALHLPNHSPFGNGLGGFGTIRDWPERFWMYLFDPALGFGTFAPLALIVFLALVVAGLIRRKPRVLVWAGFLLGTVGAFSLMWHINCGMVYCARYIIFTWPIIPMFLATDGFDLLKPVTARRILYPLIILSCFFLLFVNRVTNCYEFNATTQWILRNMPQLYAPYSATFYCRTLHIDGAYNITDPAYYLDPQTDEVRKLIYKADEGQKDRVLAELTGDGDSVVYLAEKLEKNGTDGKYHYISFPASGKYQVREKTPEDKGELISGATVVEEHDFTAGYPEDGRLIWFPFTIKQNTVYKVELSLAEDTDFNAAIDARMIVDFYGPNYDRPEQQAAGFIRDGRYDYTFYFDAGDTGTETLDGTVRLFTADSSVDVETLRITEMESTQ